MGYCADLVKAQDKDRYFITMFAEPDRREALCALYAFNHEIAKTRDVVTDTMIGHMRLQWWRDAIDEIYKKKDIRRHEVIQPLAEAISTYKLNRAYFDKLLYAREFDLEDQPPESMQGLENYVEYTNAPLYRLALQIQGQHGRHECTVSDHIASATGLAGLMRAYVHFARHRRVFLPSDLMAQHKIRESKVFDLKPQDGLPLVVETIMATAREHLDKAAEMDVDLPPSFYAQAALNRLYLKQFKKCCYNPLDHRLTLPPFLKELRVLLAVRAGRI